MATLGNTVLTLTDWAKRNDPDGNVADIIEILDQNNAVVQDTLWQQGNLTTGHRTTIRTGMPTIVWRLLNQAVTPSKSTTAQIDEMCGMMAAYSEVDIELAKLNGHSAAFRLSEARAFIEAMAQEYAQTLFYGNTGTTPEEFLGLSTRYSSTTAGNGQNVILGGGVGADNSSIWLIGWGGNTVHGIFPSGSQAGIEHMDKGQQTVTGTTGIGGTRLEAFVDYWTWKVGLVVKDWRYAVRAPNIDISNLIAKSSAADLFDLMIKMTHRLPSLDNCSPAFYMNVDCFQMLDIQARDDVQTGGQLSYQVVDGKRVTMFRGIPVRRCDQLLTNEALVS